MVFVIIPSFLHSEVSILVEADSTNLYRPKKNPSPMKRMGLF